MILVQSPSSLAGEREGEVQYVCFHTSSNSLSLPRWSHVDVDDEDAPCWGWMEVTKWPASTRPRRQHTKALRFFTLDLFVAA